MMDMEATAGLAPAKVSAEVVAVKGEVLAAVNAQALHLKSTAAEVDLLRHGVTAAPTALVEAKSAAAQATTAVSAALHDQLADVKSELASVEMTWQLE